MDSSNPRPRRDVQYPALADALGEVPSNPFTPPRATLADRERRDYGIEPMDARSIPAFDALGRRREIAQALIKRERISSVMDVDLGPALSVEECRQRDEAYYREREGLPARETNNRVRAAIGLPTLPEDRFASAQFDGDAPPEDEPVVDVADYVSGLEQDADALAAEVRRVTTERDALRAQLVSSEAGTVALLLNKSGRVASIWKSEAAARAKADKYNADPFVEPGTPDEDAPYTVEVWSLRGAER